ncbi:MAG: PHP domain-containing protein [Promethearchaeia archaeon]
MMDTNLPLMNLHTHTVYSDGKSTISALVKSALDHKLVSLAITDHFTNSWKANAIPSLDSSSLIGEYLADISACQNLLLEHQKPLKLFKGIEIDLGSSFEYIMDLINPEQFDLILFEYLENFEGLNYVEKLLKTWKPWSTGAIFGLAHFDPSYFSQEDYPIVVDFLQKHNLIFELNSRYQRYFSLKYSDFYKLLKEREIPVSIGTDSHSLARINDFDIIYQRIENLELQKNVSLLLEMLE